MFVGDLFSIIHECVSDLNMYYIHMYVCYVERKRIHARYVKLLTFAQVF